MPIRPGRSGVPWAVSSRRWFRRERSLPEAMSAKARSTTKCTHCRRFFLHNDILARHVITPEWVAGSSSELTMLQSRCLGFGVRCRQRPFLIFQYLIRRLYYPDLRNKVPIQPIACVNANLRHSGSNLNYHFRVSVAPAIFLSEEGLERCSTKIRNFT